IGFGFRRVVTAFPSRRRKTERPRDIRSGSSWSSMTGRRAVTRARDDFDGFTVHITRDEDGDWLACLAELPNVSAFAETPDGAVEELRQAWEGIKESYRKHKEPIPAAPGQNDDSVALHIPI